MLNSGTVTAGHVIDFKCRNCGRNSFAVVLCVPETKQKQYGFPSVPIISYP